MTDKEIIKAALKIYALHIGYLEPEEAKRAMELVELQ